MKNEDYLYELLEKEADGTYSLTIKSSQFIKLQKCLEYLELTKTFLDSETEEVFASEFVSTSGEKRIRIVPSLFSDDAGDEEICNENLKKFLPPTVEGTFLVFEFFHNDLRKQKKDETELNHPPVLLISRVSSVLKVYMRVGNKKLYAFCFEERN